MALGDGIRRNIAAVDPAERALLRDALIELNRRFFAGRREDQPPGRVSWWFKQDEIHQATHVHHGPEFIPWHRELVNRMEQMLRQVNPQLSLHYWDWTQDPTRIPNANLGGGLTGTLTLFTSDFMGYGGASRQAIGPPWQNATAPWRNDGFYLPGANPDRDSFPRNPADPPVAVNRSVAGSPASAADDAAILNAGDYAPMRSQMEDIHDAMHGFVSMGGPHISFRDPFVFLLHSNVDRLFARWQTDPAHPERLLPDTVYGTESNLNVAVAAVTQNVNHNIEPWSTGHSIDQFGTAHVMRPWSETGQGVAKSYKHPSIVVPPRYDTNHAYLHWTGDFTGAGKQVVFWFDDGSWWLGTFTGSQIGFTKAGNTVGFGNLADGGHPSWVGDFTGSGKAEILFNYVGDGNWWLGTFAGNQIGFTGAGTTVVRIGLLDATRH